MLTYTELLGRAARWPLRFAPRGRDVRILIGPLAGARWVVGNGNHGCWIGTYEREVQTLFRRFVQPGTTVLDLGANFGFYSLLAARLVGPNGHVIAFEPMRSTLSILRRHFAINPALAERVTVIESAVGDADGETTIAFENDLASASIHPLDQVSHTLTVPIVRLDTLLQQSAIRAPISFAKIDVEGAEVDVLNGAAQLLDTQRPALVVSCHSARWHEDVRRILRGHGYHTTEHGSDVIATHLH